MKHAHAGIAGGVLVEDLSTVVGRGVVDRDYLKVGEGLAEDRVETLAQIALNPVDRNDEAEQGHGASDLPRRSPGRTPRAYIPRAAATSWRRADTAASA